MQPAAKMQIVAIDLLRFGCAALVMLYHFAPLASFHGTAGALSTEAPLWFGWIGVQLFFVISGYVIACSAVDADAGSFLRRRILRLAPAAWFCASFTAVVLLMTGAVPAMTVGIRWLEALSFWPTTWPIDGSYWTLSVELAFYLLVAGVLRLAGGSPRRIEGVGIVLGAASLALWAAAFASGTPTVPILASLPLRVSQLPYGAFFSLGISLWAIRPSGATLRRFVFASLVSVGCLAEISVDVARSASEHGGVPYQWVPYAIFAGGVAMIAGAGWLQPGIARLGETRLATIGRMTYPLYLLHHVAGLGLILFLIAAGVSSGVAVALISVLMLALSWYVTVRLEPRLRRVMAAWIDSLSRRHGPGRDSRRSASLPIG